ncbi:MAG: hypothetical protein HZB99_01325 [Candidatus Harrisonbacteria bacterium]|nr:hypothetical protein [Candidatus Harrisonbacteria bacterium]
MAHKITSFIIVEANRVKRGKELPPGPPAKSAPHYFEKSVPAQHILGQEKIKVDGVEIVLAAKTYHPDAILVEGTFEVENIFENDGLIELKDKVHEACYEFAKKNGGKDEPAEEYAVYQISGYKGDPELFLKGHAAKIAGLLKSEKLELDEKEVEHTLASQFKYAKDDLIIVDWDGAFVFDPEGEFEETIELFELANYQLLRYRILDEDLDERMRQMSKLIQAEDKRRKWLWPSREVTQEFREVIRVRSQSVTQFEGLEREIKLIGDWYLARLYDLLSKKFRLEDWRERIKEKLDSLEDVYSIASENLGMSRMQRLELIQIWGFFILQIGWLVLIILEFFYFTR